MAMRVGESLKARPPPTAPRAPMQELALCADVEEASLEGESDRQAAEDERGGRRKRVDDRVKRRPKAPSKSAS